MRFRPLVHFNTDDYRTAPQWFSNFLSVMNLMVDTLNSLLQNNVDIDNNLLAERQTVSVIHNVPTTVKMRKLAQTPFLVRAGYASGHVVTGCSITGYNNDGTVQITVQFSGAPTTAIATTLIFEP